MWVNKCHCKEIMISGIALDVNLAIGRALYYAFRAKCIADLEPCLAGITILNTFLYINTFYKKGSSASLKLKASAKLKLHQNFEFLCIQDIILLLD